MYHHKLDVYPVPRESMPRYINEPWLIDKTLSEGNVGETPEPEDEKDNIRIYIPMDLNRKSILRRLDGVIAHYGEANEENEFDFTTDVDMVLSQMEIYDQVWYTRHIPPKGDHSAEAISLVREIIARLEAIPDGCAELFPFETIDALKSEYLVD